MKLKPIILGLGGALLLAGIVLGPATLFSHLRATREAAKNTLDDMLPDVEKAAQIKVELNATRSLLQVYSARVEDVAGRAVAGEAEAAKIDATLRSERAILARARRLLDQKRERYEIGGKTYSRQQVRLDASGRLNRCRLLLEQQTFHQSAAARLRGLERTARGRLQEASQTVLTMQAELNQLKERLADAGLTKDVNELAARLDRGPLTPDSPLADAFDRFRRRVRIAERQAVGHSTATQSGILVEWDAQQSDREVSEAIGRFLKQSPASGGMARAR